MNRIKKIVVKRLLQLKIQFALISLIFSLSSCHVFWYNEHDTSPLQIFDSLWTSFYNTYALFEVRGIDWHETRKQFLPRISHNMSSLELFQVCAEMLNTLQDPHVTLTAPFGNSFELIDNIPDHFFSLQRIRNEYLIDRGRTAADGRILYGKIRPDRTHNNVGYIHFMDFHIGDVFSTNWINEFDSIIKSFSGTDFLIVDVRNSLGGFSVNMKFIASRFIAHKSDFLKIRTKNGPQRNDFSDPVTMTIHPADIRYTNPIVLLTNNETVSAAEWFVLALKTQRHVTHAGETTRGALSVRVTRNLTNGWRYSLSIQKITDMNGRNFEGIGISPNREHTLGNFDDSPLRNQDRQLEYALTLH